MGISTSLNSKLFFKKRFRIYKYLLDFVWFSLFGQGEKGYLIVIKCVRTLGRNGVGWLQRLIRYIDFHRIFIVVNTHAIYLISLSVFFMFLCNVLISTIWNIFFKSQSRKKVFAISLLNNRFAPKNLGNPEQQIFTKNMKVVVMYEKSSSSLEIYTAR